MCFSFLGGVEMPIRCCGHSVTWLLLLMHVMNDKEEGDKNAQGQNQKAPHWAAKVNSTEELVKYLLNVSV